MGNPGGKNRNMTDITSTKQLPVERHVLSCAPAV
jgi:hypothetical protein